MIVINSQIQPYILLSGYQATTAGLVQSQSISYSGYTWVIAADFIISTAFIARLYRYYKDRNDNNNDNNVIQIQQKYNNNYTANMV